LAEIGGFSNIFEGFKDNAIFSRKIWMTNRKKQKNYFMHFKPQKNLHLSRRWIGMVFD